MDEWMDGWMDGCGRAEENLVKYFILREGLNAIG